MDDGCSDGHITQDSNDASDDASRMPRQTFHIVSEDDNIDRKQGVSLCNSMSSTSRSGPGATIVQYSHGPNGQYFIPVHSLGSSGGMMSFPPGGMMVASGAGSIGNGSDEGEEAVRRRELRLLKNKEAAKECRRKKKEYVRCLENRVAVLENQNKTLIEELKSLKELYCQKDVHS